MGGSCQKKKKKKKKMGKNKKGKYKKNIACLRIVVKQKKKNQKINIEKV